MTGVRAVFFDLWDTIVDFSREPYERHRAEVIRRLAVDPQRLDEIWNSQTRSRYVGPLREFLVYVCSELGADHGAVDELLELRRSYARRALVPRPGAVETIDELRGRGLRVGLISVCTSEVSDVWDETPLAGLFDATVLSCDVGLTKPDPRIYELACELLDVDARNAVFVGDGANDELAGAERAGMRAILVLRPEQEEPYWPEAQGWQPRVTALPDLLGLLSE